MNPDALLAYFNSRPDFARAYNESKGNGDKRTPTQWMEGWISDPGNNQNGSNQADAFSQFAKTNNLQAYSNTTPNGSLGLPGITDAINDATLQGANRAAAGGNLSQVQAGQQSGNFDTTGTTNTSQSAAQSGATNQATQMATNQTGSGTSQSSQVGNQTGTSSQNTSGTTDQTNTTNQSSTGSTTGQTSSSGQTTNKVDDSLGLGALVAAQAGKTAQSDDARSKFLTDTMQNGGTAFREQVAQATNRATSGPGMQGVGNMAQGRAVGAAVGDVARNDQAARLQAAQQLAGPTGLVTAANQTTGFLGNTGNTTGSSATSQQTQQLLNGITNLVGKNSQNTTGATSGTTTMDQTGSNTSNQATSGTQNSQGTSNSLGLTNVVGTENNKGSSAAASGQVATGQVPENTQSSSGGGCYVCTAYHILGKHCLSRSITDAVKFKLANLHTYGLSLLGYSVYGPYLARLVLKSPIFAAVFYPFAMAVLYEELRLSGRVHRHSWFARCCHAVFNYGGSVFGCLVYLSGRKTIRTTDTKILNLLRRNNLYFHV